MSCPAGVGSGAYCHCSARQQGRATSSKRALGDPRGPQALRPPRTLKDARGQRDLWEAILSIF